VRDEAEQLQLDGFLVKPVTKSMVVDALVNAFLEEGEAAAVVSRAESGGVSLAGLRVLLVEDNDINQQIAVELLEGVGAQVIVANHGGEALERLTTGPMPPPFDVVLMDLQMPVMDGHQATARIRADARLAALPVIAMTAHATVEERDACLAGGMNGHIAKPIEPAVLFATLAAWQRRGAAAAPVRPRSSEAASAGPETPAIAGLDVAGGLARVAGNVRLYHRLLRQFAERQSGGAEPIFTALARDDRLAAERLAHALKGVSGNLGATAVHTAAGRVEKMLRDQADEEALAQAVRELQAHLEPFVAAVTAALPATEPVAVESAPVDPARTKAAALELAKLLTGFDAGATAYLEANEKLLRPAFADTLWPQFTRHIQEFAFADAKVLLDQALARMGG